MDMQNLPEGVLYAVALAVAYLATYLFKRFGPPMEPEPAQAAVDEEAIGQEPVAADQAAPSTTATHPLLGPRVAAAKAMLQSQPRSPLPRLALLGSKRDKQIAVAMATILGPCRAFEAHGDPASPSRS
jgi:hypothetical protein